VCREHCHSAREGARAAERHAPPKTPHRDRARRRLRWRRPGSRSALPRLSSAWVRRWKRGTSRRRTGRAGTTWRTSSTGRSRLRTPRSSARGRGHPRAEPRRARAHRALPARRHHQAYPGAGPDPLPRHRGRLQAFRAAARLPARARRRRLPPLALRGPPRLQGAASPPHRAAHTRARHRRWRAAQVESRLRLHSRQLHHPRRVVRLVQAAVNGDGVWEWRKTLEAADTSRIWVSSLEMRKIAYSPKHCSRYVYVLLSLQIAYYCWR
jgi:hypothetical protein